MHITQAMQTNKCNNQTKFPENVTTQLHATLHIAQCMATIALHNAFFILVGYLYYWLCSSEDKKVKSTFGGPTNDTGVTEIQILRTKSSLSKENKRI